MKSDGWLVAVLLGLSVCGPARPDTFVGKVLTRDGKPIANARVKLSSRDLKTAQVSEADGQGVFRFRTLPPGYYALEVFASGFCPEYARNVEINERKYGAQEYTYVLLRPGSVSGFVYGEDGKPLRDALVRLSRDASARTDSRGFYRIGWVKPGGASLRISAADHVPAWLGVQVEERKETAGSDAKLLLAGKVSGRIVDQNTKNPMPGVSVYASGEGSYGETRSGKNGTFVLEGLAPGTYQVNAYTQGYESGGLGNIEVRKLRTTSVPDMGMTLRAPFFSLYRRALTFLPSEDVFLSYGAFRVQEVSVAIHAVDLAGEIAGMQDSRQACGRDGLSRVQDRDRGGQTPVLSKEVAITYKRPLMELYDRRIVLGKLPVGAYVATVTPKGLSAERQFFLVTDLAVVSKSSQGRSVLFACDIATGRPAADADVLFLTREWTVRDRRRTDVSGLVERDGPGRESDWVVARSGESYAFLNQFYRGAETGSSYTYLYTERPVYRPGQTVYYKGILRREQDGTSYDVVRNRDVEVRVQDAYGNVLIKETARVGGSGSLAGSFALPEEPPLGTYQIGAWEGDSFLGGGSFKVLEYRKPDYRVEVLPEKDRYFPRENIRVLVRAQYFFGAPVEGAEVQYSVYARTRGWWDDQEDYDEEEYGWGYGQQVAAGQGVTNDRGELVLEVPAKESYPSENVYTIEACVTDRSRREIKGTGSVSIVPGMFSIRISAGGYMYEAGREIPLKVAVRRYDGLETGRIALKVLAESERYADGKMERRELFSREAITDAGGDLSITLPPVEEGHIRIFVQGQDEKANIVTDTRYVWVTSRTFAGSWYGGGELEIVCDRKKYLAGETAKVLLNCRYPDISLLVSLEGFRLFETRVVQLQGHTALLDIPLKPEYAPSVTLSTCGVSRKRFLHAEKVFDIPPQDRLLTVSLSSDREKYRPGETVRYSISTFNHAGRPVPAELSLGVVDEAIYAVSGEMVPPIEKFFYGRKPNRVSLRYSFYEWLYGGAGKDEAVDEVRRDFRDTAFWEPFVRTGSDGKATCEVVLPDNLTTWRATARAVTERTDVGTGMRKVISTRPLVARLILPRFFVEDDQMVVSGVIHNYTDRPQDLSVKFSAEGLDVLSAGERTLSVAPGRSSRVDWVVRVRRSPSARALLAAVSPQVRDAMELTVPVLPYRQSELVYIAGECRDTATDTVAVPARAVPGSVALNTRMSASIAADLFRSLEYLATYPYGCVEQTISGFLPAVCVAGALKDIGAEDLAFLASDRDRFEGMMKTLPGKVRSGIARLYGFQQADGGWGWWGTDASSPYTTAYVFYGLCRAGKAGYPVDEERLQRAESYLRNLLSSFGTGNLDRKTCMLFALSERAPLNASLYEEVYRNRSFMNVYSRALLVLVLKRSGDARAEGLLDELWKEGKERTPYAVFWRSEEPGLYSWVHSDIEATAWVLRATLAVKPTHPETVKAVRYLLMMQKNRAWRSTKDTAVCVMALTDFLTAAKELSPDYVASLSVNGRKVRDVRMDRTVLKTGAVSVDTPAEYMPLDRESTLVLNKQGSGNLYYEHRLGYDVRDVFLAARSQGFSIRREYRRVAWKKDASGQLSRSLEKIEGPVSVGDTLEVTLTLSGEPGYEYVMVEDPLPAGCEVREDDAGQWYWCCRREIRDEKVAFFTPLWGEKERTVVYHVRAETPGTYHVLPARASMMYFPEVYGHSLEDRITIAEKKE